jgi:hypothetical protein
MNVGHCALLLTKQQENDMLNITQHAVSAEQQAVGVYDVEKKEWRESILVLLTFTDLPTKQEVEERAYLLVELIEEILLDTFETSGFSTRSVMIGGAPYLMAPLAEMLYGAKITPFFAYSERVSSEVNGVKTSVFKHLGFVQA